MIKGTGIDIIEISRIANSLKKHGFAKKIFSEEEIVYCESKKKSAAMSYAARFAAKEAFVKALGTGFRSGAFTDIIVVNDELGAPQIVVKGYYLEIIKEKNVVNIHLSLSHIKEMAIAQVILEG